MEAGKDATDAHAHFVAQPVDKGLLADVYPATVNGTCRHNLYVLCLSTPLCALAKCTSDH